jgi:hypothetical protein
LVSLLLLLQVVLRKPGDRGVRGGPRLASTVRLLLSLACGKSEAFVHHQKQEICKKQNFCHKIDLKYRNSVKKYNHNIALKKPAISGANGSKLSKFCVHKVDPRSLFYDRLYKANAVKSCKATLSLVRLEENFVFFTLKNTTITKMQVLSL